MILKPWLVHDGDEDYAWKWLAWAPDEEAACEVCRRWTDFPPALEATLCTELKPKDGDEPYLDADDETLRRLGFRCESDDRCETCDLYSMDGKFPVCDMCGQCGECCFDGGCIYDTDEDDELE